jgi:hypothetical protein
VNFIPFERAIDFVEEERRQQDIQWGGPPHDDTRTPENWADYMEKQLKLFRTEKSEDRLKKIAALAIAALEQRFRNAS